VRLGDITLWQGEIAKLPGKAGFAPYAGGFQMFVEVPMDFPSQVGHRALI
jgi:hypothetical protein